MREWLALYTPKGATVLTNALADEAVRQMGTNVIPTLLRMIEDTDSPLKLKLIVLMQKQHFFPPPRGAYFRNFQAVLAFTALGPTASNAAPALVQIYLKKSSLQSQVRSLDALRGIGPAALPQATPVLLDALTNSINALRLHAVVALEEMRSQPELFVPPLVHALKDADPVVQRFAVRALGNYGPAAKSAVPALLPLLNNSNGAIRENAEDALKAIDPEAAAKAGVK